MIDQKSCILPWAPRTLVKHLVINSSHVAALRKVIAFTTVLIYPLRDL